MRLLARLACITRLAIVIHALIEWMPTLTDWYWVVCDFMYTPTRIEIVA